MILRRFMKHVTDQNWFAVGLDVVVVIVGIFLGLQVSDLNEDRKDRMAAEAFLDKLAVDIHHVVDNFKEAEEDYRDRVEMGKIAIRYLRGEVTIEAHAIEIDRGFNEVVRTGGFPMHAGNLEIILSGQNFPKIEDLSLYTFMDELLVAIKKSEDTVNHIREEINLTIPVINRYYSGNDGLGDDFPILFDVEAMRQSNEFKYALQSATVSQNYTANHYRSNIRRFEEILALLEARNQSKPR